MKHVHYKTIGRSLEYSHETNQIERKEVIVPVTRVWSDASEELAKMEAYNGEYEIFDDGQPEPDTTTTDDILNALLGVTV